MEALEMKMTVPFMLNSFYEWIQHLSFLVGEYYAIGFRSNNESHIVYIYIYIDWSLLS